MKRKPIKSETHYFIAINKRLNKYYVREFTSELHGVVGLVKYCTQIKWGFGVGPKSKRYMRWFQTVARLEKMCIELHLNSHIYVY